MFAPLVLFLINFLYLVFESIVDMNAKLLDTLGLSFQSLAEMELDIKDMSAFQEHSFGHFSLIGSNSLTSK